MNIIYVAFEIINNIFIKLFIFMVTDYKSFIYLNIILINITLYYILLLL